METKNEKGIVVNFLELSKFYFRSKRKHKVAFRTESKLSFTIFIIKILSIDPTDMVIVEELDESSIKEAETESFNSVNIIQSAFKIKNSINTKLDVRKTNDQWNSKNNVIRQ